MLVDGIFVVESHFSLLVFWVWNVQAFYATWASWAGQVKNIFLKRSPKMDLFDLTKDYLEMSNHLEMSFIILK